MPFDCCTRGRTAVGNRDACMCGCCPNGGFQVATAQFLLLLGTFFSAAALGDCSFVSISEGVPIPQLVPSNEDTLLTNLGLITFERPSTGRCYWYEDGINAGDQIQDYIDLLESDWQVVRVFGTICASGGFLFFVFAMAMCCTSFVRAARYFGAFLLCLVLALFQSLTFLIFASDFCAENECEFSRSAGWSIAAAVCFFFSGLCFACMTDYPGAQAIHNDDDTTKGAPVADEQAPVDEEAVSVEEEDEVEVMATEEEEIPLAEEEVEAIHKEDEELDAEDEANEEVHENTEDQEGEGEAHPTAGEVEPQVDEQEDTSEIREDEPAVEDKYDKEEMVEEEVGEVDQEDAVAVEKDVPNEAEGPEDETEDTANAPLPEGGEDQTGPNETDIPGGGDWSDGPKKANP